MVVENFAEDGYLGDQRLDELGVPAPLVLDAAEEIFALFSSCEELLEVGYRHLQAVFGASAPADLRRWTGPDWAAGTLPLCEGHSSM